MTEKAGKNRVLRSVNNEDASLCVDIFLRPDGTTGFQEFRRDAEDNRGWFPVGGHSGMAFPDEPSAWLKAMESIPWLRRVAR